VNQLIQPNKTYQPQLFIHKPNPSSFPLIELIVSPAANKPAYQFVMAKIYI